MSIDKENKFETFFSTTCKNKTQKDTIQKCNCKLSLSILTRKIKKKG